MHPAVAQATALILEGSGEVVGENIRHPSGNIFDQVLLTGQSIKLQAKPGQITRVSFMDEDEDIVQIEFSGAGNFTVNLDPATFLPAALPPRYNQEVMYVTGKASVVIEGADSSTFFSIFTVGRINAVNQMLFPEGQVYDGVADVTLVEVINSTGFGGMQLSNTVFSGSTGKVGIDARGVPIAVRLTIGDIDADGDAVPYLLFGDGSFTIPAGNSGLRITGGDLVQTNGASIVVAESGSTTTGFDTLISQNNFKSDNTPQPAQTITATFANEDGDKITVTNEDGDEITGSTEDGSLTIDNTGSLTWSLGSFTQRIGNTGCIIGDFTFNGVFHDLETSKWQMRTGPTADWSDIQDTLRTNDAICGYDLTVAAAGHQYRVVLEIVIGGDRKLYSSNIITKEPEDPGDITEQTDFTPVDEAVSNAPDLVVGTPTVDDASPETGATFTLSATVSNVGDESAAATTLRYYQSTDATITTSDTQVGADAVAGLAALESSNQSVELTAPVTPGTYYYGACVDAVVGESDTADNCSGSVLVTVVLPTPQTTTDLVVASFGVSDSRPAAGATFTLLATVQNNGNGTAAATTLRYYQSTDATITTSDTQVGADAVASLAALESSSQSIGLTAPATPGTYYYGACVDAVAGESDTADNCGGSLRVDVGETQTQLQDTLDLVVGTPTVNDASPETGATFTLSATVSNVGDGSAAATTLRYYRSTDTTITTSDTQVGSSTVAALGASATSSQSVDLTAPAIPGTYYYGACVDAVAGESDMTNNCSASVAVTVTVVEPQTSPDLVVGSPTVSNSSPTAGAQFTLSATVSNAGDATASATTLRYYRSTDATISSADTQVGTDTIEALAASGTSAESISLTAPSTSGTYYYGACVDAVAGESDTTNNCSASVAVTVTVVEPQTSPDLVVGSPTVSNSSPTAGAQFTLSATVSNAGDATASATTLRYYRSTDATISSADTQVGTDAVGALSASGTSAESISLTAPSTEGTYYYGACVDEVAGESDTTNNCSASVKVDVETSTNSPDSVKVNAPQEWAPVGDTVTYTAKVLDSEGEEISGYSISWSSSDTSKATVDTNGVVTAVAVGEASIIAAASATASVTARDFGTVASNSKSTLSGSLKMDVVKPVARIELSPSSLSFDTTDVWENVTATLYDASNNEMSPTYWGWSSADHEVARVYRRAFISGVSARVQSIGEGATTVSLNANGTRQTISVTVTLPTARVDISPRSLTFEALGDTKSVTVRILDENGDENEDATFNYTGSFSPCCRPDLADPPKSWDVERTDDGIKITSEGSGSGQFTFSSDGVENAILGVTIYMNPATLEVSPSTASLEVDGTVTLRATVKDSNGNSIHVNSGDGRGGLVVYWETSDSAVATADGSDNNANRNTGATATVTGVAAGTATITGRYAGSGGITDTATITVE